MNSLRYILSIILSLAIICGSAGVSVIEYCASGCKMKMMDKAETCCCCKKENAATENKTTQNNNCCKTTVYKLDLQQSPIGNVGNVINCDYGFVVNYLLFDSQLTIVNAHTYDRLYPPPITETSRHYLALYSTLII